ncbi:MAG: ABC transporter ATP-binding protein [Chloroflexi bacterium]|nr:ABC transporter ATP-binding protein [Chloroflexota bacterium]MCI0789603.1 ABC transporter ATP-binding protein [Chloroflexota bacterium]MCI0829458.1 ABC transporter ATP-binding protein [Chloroflexota bacterium]MCI0847535.1 ABC transporter ATP-binding protein [Chloroflexota bacterium]MCI0864515.1 ABC transporter ATP-binding protein [Chloroflexota bacterium]
MQILVRITKIAWQFRARLILAYLSFLAAIGVSLLIPHIFGEAIDLLVSGESVSTRTLTYFALALLGASLVRGFLDFARTYCTDSLSQKVSYDIRNRFYDKLQHLSFAYHDKEHTGELMSKATADVEAIRRFVNMGLVRALEVVVRVIALILILSFMNWELTLISLSFVPFIVIRSSIVMGRLRRMWLQVQLRMGEAVTILQENLVGIHVVKAFASEEFEKKKFAKKAQELREEYYQSERLQGTNSAWMTLFFTSGMGLILWYGGWEVIRGNLTEGGLTKFILYLSQLTFPIRMSSFIINSFSRAITSGGRIFDVIDAESPVVEKPDARVLDRPQGRVEFEDVSFAYESRMPALQHLSIAAEPGQITAILGAPGSGKSTIVNLLPRFYDVSEGRITIDGQDIRDFTLESLRHNVGIVQQDVFLFSATIHDNIAYGVKDATREAVIEAATVAQLHDHIDSLPDGYDTWVGERGSTLSGGQRQRLSIARSILTDPPVLILDDSTSSVDVETERMIHRAMVNVMKDRTTFVIAHRLSTVREADLIVVLKDGQIAEQGTHEELLAANSFYRDIYDLQLQPQEELLLDASITPDKEIQTGGAGSPRLASEIGDD